MEAKRNSAPGEGLTPEAAARRLTPEDRAEWVLDEYRKRCNLPSDWHGWVGTEIIADAIRAAELAAEARGLEQAADVCREHWRGLILNDGARAAATYLERKLRAMTLARSAPPAPAAPICSAEEK